MAERKNKEKYSKKTAHHIKDNHRFSDPGGKFNIGFSVEVTVRPETGAPSYGACNFGG